MPQKLSQKLPRQPIYEKSQTPRWGRLVNSILSLPRITRILVVGIFALAATLAVSPLVDFIYDRYFFARDTVMAPALVTTVLGLTMYLIGWWLVVGTVGEKPDVRRMVLWYFGLGFAAVITVAVLIAVGIRLLNFVE